MPRRALGRHLLALRQKAKLRVNDVAEKMDWSPPTLWRIETGRKAVRTVDVQLLCGLYGADDETRAGLVELAKETKSKDWWKVYGDAIPSWLDLFLGLEEAADTFRWYEAHAVPGIVQTERYIRVVLQADKTLSASEVDKRVRARLERQAIMTSRPEPPRYEFVLDEDVLRRPIASPEIMVEQLERLAQVSELPNVRLRVLPYSAGMHPGLRAAHFVILTFPQIPNGYSEPDTVYVEDLAGAHYLDKPSDIERYASAFDDLKERSLDESATRDFIQQTARSLT